MKRHFLSVVVTGWLLGQLGCSGSEPDRWDVRDVNARLGKGVNLGNALDAPGEEGAWGVTLQEKYFVALAERGFMSVRLPTRFSDHMQSTPPYTVDPAFLARVDWAIDSAEENGLSIVLDVHHFLQLMDDPSAYREMFLALWQQLSSHYADKGPFLVFEPLNEPRDKLTPQLWNQLIKDVLAVIRKTNPKRAVVLGGADYSHAASLEDLDLPDDRYLIASFHFYDPMTFTHQGAGWVTGSVEWLGTPFRNEPTYTSALMTTFDQVAAWQKRTGRPITIGEFGSIHLADLTSRSIYAAFTSRQFAARGWSFTYWNFASDFGIYDTGKDELIADLADALLTPDAILGRPVSTKPDPAPPEGPSVLVDDFEDTLGDRPEQGAIAATLAQERGTSFEASPGDWIPFANSDSTLTTVNGTPLVGYLTHTETGTAYNTREAISATGHPGHSYRMKMHLKGDQYPFAGVVCVFSGDWKQGAFDLSELTALSFWARGNGAMRVALVPDVVVNGYPEADAWGYFGTEFVVGTEWHRFVVPAAALVPKPYSPQAKDALTWDEVRQKVGAIHFEVGQSYGKVVDTNLELELDEVRLHGVTMDVFRSQNDGGAQDADGATAD